jgi:hypothetical protein
MQTHRLTEISNALPFVVTPVGVSTDLGLKGRSVVAFSTIIADILSALNMNSSLGLEASLKIVNMP